MKILIAGASGGIGKFLAEKLSEEHDVYGTYHSRKPDSSLQYKMEEVDVTDVNQVSAWVLQSCSAEDELALVYSVGVNYNCMMHKSDSILWREVIDSNLNGVQHVLRHVLPLMREKRFGRIVLLSSVVPQIGVPGTSAYAASKAALWGLSKAVAKENAAYGITINTINLGYFDVGMIQNVPEELLKQIIEDIPMKHLGDPMNILKTIAYLVSVDYLTGSEIDLNGGFR
jgi:acetoacetyl-CoA reductase/3-oxoacyl-[acyl-carrier protein] reductase